MRVTLHFQSNGGTSQWFIDSSTICIHPFWIYLKTTPTSAPSPPKKNLPPTAAAVFMLLVELGFTLTLYICYIHLICLNSRGFTKASGLTVKSGVSAPITSAVTQQRSWQTGTRFKRQTFGFLHLGWIHRSIALDACVTWIMCFNSGMHKTNEKLFHLTWLLTLFYGFPSAGPELSEPKGETS